MTDKLKVLDLFSGIGGFSLGLERTGGFETVAFCEIESFPRKVLAKHWPKVPCYHDVRELTAARLAADGIAVDVICGGFPCQDISTAGKGVGIAGARSGLWKEYARLIGELRPRYILVENVAALLGRGLGVVLGDLAAFGYDAEWHCIPASAVGAPHLRDRLWILAYPNSHDDGGEAICRGIRSSSIEGLSQEQGADGQRHRRGFSNGGETPYMADANYPRQQPSSGAGENGRNQARDHLGRRSADVAHAERRRPQSGDVKLPQSAAIVPAAYSRHRGGGEFGALWWVEPELGRVAYGVPNQAQRIRALGNAVVPQIPELIGRAILESIAPPTP